MVCPRMGGGGVGQPRGNLTLCSSRKYLYSPSQKGLEFPGGEGRGGKGGFVRPKKLKKCMNLNWNFQRGGEGVLEKIPSMGEVWIFSRITHFQVFKGQFPYPWISVISPIVFLVDTNL